MIESLSHSNKIILPNYLEQKLQIDGITIQNFLPFNFPQPAQMPGKENPYSITLREKACLQLIAQGYTMKSVAKKLALSLRTVESHLRNIKDKNGLNTKNQLVDMWNEYYNSTDQEIL